MAVYGISLDSVSEQARFAQEHELGFPLLSDPDGSGAAKYEVPLIRGLYASRATFVIDPTGVVRHIDHEVRVDTHGEDLLALIARLRE